MSQENVEIVRRAIDAWNRRDLAGLLDLAAPGIEYVNSPEAVEPGTKRGLDEVVGVFRSQWESLPGGRMDINQLHDRGDEVIGVGRVSRLMPGSEARVGNPVLLSWRLENGRITRTEMLGAATRFQKALEAAGLSE